MCSFSRFRLVKLMGDYVQEGSSEELYIYYLLVNEPNRNNFYFFKLIAKEFQMETLDDETLIDFAFYGTKERNHIQCLRAFQINNEDALTNDAVFFEAINNSNA